MVVRINEKFMIRATGAAQTCARASADRFINIRIVIVLAIGQQFSSDRVRVIVRCDYIMRCGRLCFLLLTSNVFGIPIYENRQRKNIQSNCNESSGNSTEKWRKLFSPWGKVSLKARKHIRAILIQNVPTELSFRH